MALLTCGLRKDKLQSVREIANKPAPFILSTVANSNNCCDAQQRLMTKPVLSAASFRNEINERLRGAARTQDQFLLSVVEVQVKRPLQDSDKLKVMACLERSILSALSGKDPKLSKFGENQLAVFAGHTSSGHLKTDVNRLLRDAMSIKQQAISDEVAEQLQIHAGVALFPNDGLSLLGLISKADYALMRAKFFGGSCLCFAGANKGFIA